MMQNRVGTTTPVSAAETEEFEWVLSKLESQVKSLYDDEEKSFFVALSRSLHSNQTLQIYLLALSALVLVSGGVLGVSLHRTVGALKKEMSERDRVEGHLQEANDQIVRSEKLAALA
ncbi:MAG: hypothetical protein IIB66_05825 [Proteobacteria bacterium]|nr:hypothetical protein [Pseudomonadota bacterium]